MIISYSKNFVYIHLDKCGGTSIEDAIKPYLSVSDIKLGGLTFNTSEEDLYLKKYNLKKHSDAKSIKLFLGKDWDTLYKFTTVRNPKEVMISLFYYVKQNYKPNTDDPYFITYENCIKNKNPIDIFIKMMIEGGSTSTMSFTSRLDSSVEIFDISDINNHWQYILNKINIDDNIPLKTLNKSIKPISVNLLPETIDIIKDRFKEDYENIPKITGIKWY